MVTAWQIAIKLNTSSTAPAAFRKIGAAARAAAGDVRKLDQTFGLLNRTLDDKTASALTRAQRGFQTLANDGTAAYTGLRRSASLFSRTATAASRQSVASFQTVNASLVGIMRDANRATYAFGRMASAARAVPRSVGPMNRPSAIAGDSGGLGALGLAAGGAVAGSALWSGIRSAADVQQMQAQLNIAGVKQSDMGRVDSLAMLMSMSTAQSVTDSTNLLKTMAVSGLNSIPGVSTLQALQALSMPIAQYADVNYLNTGRKHMDFEDSAVLASGLAHDMRLYDPNRMTGFLQTLARAGYESSHGPAILGNMMRQFAPRATNYGMSPEDIVNYAALADRAGQSLRGGTGLNMLLANLAAPRGKAKNKALDEMGIYNGDGTSRFVDERTGAVNFQGFLQYVAAYRDQMKLSGKGALANRLEQRGFDTNAARLLDAIGTTQMVGKGGMLDTMRTNEQHSMTLQQMQQRLMAGLNSQTRLLTTNFQTLMQQIANPLIPSLASLVHNLADMTGGLAMFFHDHPHAAGAAAAGLGAVALAGTVASLAVGGYIAHGAIGSLLGHAGGYRLASALGQGGTTLARGGLGGMAMVGAGRAAAGGGAAARLAGGAGRFLGLGAIGATKGLFGDVGLELRNIRLSAAIAGRGFLTSRAGLLSLGEIAAKLGLRAVPVVGEVLMLVDSIRFLGNHARDIGKGIGVAVGWIMYHGGPMLGNAIVGVIKAAINMLMHPGSIIAGVWNWGVNAVKSGVAGVQQGVASQAPTPAKLATGGYTLGEGLAYLHRNELVVKHPTVQKLERMTAPGGRGGGRPIVISLSPKYVAAPGESDAMHRRRMKRMVDELAEAVAAKLASNFGLALQSGGATPQFADQSIHAILAGVPS